MDLVEGSEDGSSIAGHLRPYVLHDAAEAGDVDLIRQLAEQALKKPDLDFDPTAPSLHQEEGRLDLEERDDNQCTPLHIAILKGRPQAVAALLILGADIRRACEGSPPLHLAVCSAAHPRRTKAALEIVKLLLDHGASVGLRDDNGRTAFHWAAWLSLPRIITLLLESYEKEIEAEKVQHEERNSAVLAVGGEPLPPYKKDSLHMLKDKQGNTALHLAATSHRAEACSHLLYAQGGTAAAAVENKTRQTPLHLAAASGSLETVKKLLTAEQKAFQVQDKSGRTPSQWAAFRGYKEVAKCIDETVRATRANSGWDGNSTMDVDAKPLPPTVILAPPACLEHRTVAEPILRGEDVPPENVRRLHVLTDEEEGILRTSEFEDLEWDQEDRLAPIGDVLRVHEWKYVQKLKKLCNALADDPTAIGHLDGDTALSRKTFNAALAGAGACCRAVDCIMEGSARNAFCAVRPPGHHAGPLGLVTGDDPNISQSQGFCFLNNLAIAGAYAVNTYRHQGVRRVALLDFDVHHGNGTQACVARVVPQTLRFLTSTPLSEGYTMFPSYHPWLDDDDAENILFASVQGFRKSPREGTPPYPGSGATFDTKLAAEKKDQEAEAQPMPLTPGTSPMGHTQDPDPNSPHPDLDTEYIPDPDPDVEFAAVPGYHPPANGPRIINVGIPGPGAEISMWRRAWRDKILPAVADFKPDIIIVSAGFDAHRKDFMNSGYIGVTERDYYWLTQQLVSLSNTLCKGRLVSALEGGYRIQGEVVSAFSRSVAAHVRALKEDNRQVWDPEEAKKERAAEIKRRKEVLAAKVAAIRLREKVLKEERERQERLAAAAAANLAAAVPAGPSDSAFYGKIYIPPTVPENEETLAQPVAQPVVQPVAQPVALEAAGDGKKRRRAPVDYTALNLKLEEESKRPKTRSGGAGSISNSKAAAGNGATSSATSHPREAAAQPDTQTKKSTKSK